jgi:hypothetical protein
MGYFSFSPTTRVSSDLWVRSVSVSTDYGGGFARVDVELLARCDDLSYEKIIQEISPRWNSCSDCLPEDDSPVLVCNDDDVTIACHWGDGEWSISPIPTHWQALPAPAENQR